LNEQGTLSDIEKLCGSDKIGACLSSKCGNSLKEAQDHFTNTCKANGYTACAPLPLLLTIQFLY